MRRNLWEGQSIGRLRAVGEKGDHCAIQQCPLGFEDWMEVELEKGCEVVDLDNSWRDVKIP